MDLRIAATGDELTVSEGTTVVIGADPSATVRVARPGISRRHAVVTHDGSHWVLQDASSRNGTFHNGARIQRLDVKGPTTVWLGHPTSGTEVQLIPTTTSGATASPYATSTPTDSSAPAAAPSQPAQTPEPSIERTRVAPSTPPAAGAVDPRLDDLIDALSDTMRSVRGLSWSVWAMIAITAVLAILTLFVGIIGN